MLTAPNAIDIAHLLLPDRCQWQSQSRQNILDLEADATLCHDSHPASKIFARSLHALPAAGRRRQAARSHSPSHTQVRINLVSRPETVSQKTARAASDHEHLPSHAFVPDNMNRHPANTVRLTKTLSLDNAPVSPNKATIPPSSETTPRHPPGT